MLPSALLHPDGTRLNFRAYALLFFLSLASFSFGLFSIPPTDRDESLYAQASKQMIETGNYIDIRYQDQPRYKKPIGIYWAQAAIVQLFSPEQLDRIGIYRIPSLIGATASVLLTAAIGSVLFNPSTGFLAALMLASCLLLNVEARLAKTDAALLAATLLMIYGLAKAFMAKSAADWLTFFAFWLGLGASLLIKGPMALLILIGLLLWLHLSSLGLSWLKNLRPKLGVPLLLLTTLPWFLAIILQSNGNFLHESAGQDLLKKIWHGQGGFRPPGMHALIFPVLFFPASLFVLLAIPDTWHNRTTPAVRFCLGWVIPFWIVFELSFTKLPHYVLPTYPALALLAAGALINHYPALNPTDDRPRLFWPAFSVLVWLLVGSALAVGTILLPQLMGGKGINYTHIAASFLLHILMGGSLLMLLYRREKAVLLTTCASLIFFGSSFGHILPNLPHLWLAQDIRKAVKQSGITCSPDYLASGYSEPSFIFLTATTTRLANTASALANSFKSTPCPIAVVSSDRSDPFVAEAQRLGVSPKKLAELQGFNMGAGRQTTLHIYSK